MLIILLSITKRAQIPSSSWLPSAIAAPTPVRALVHSSTLVTAGVYVLIRYCHTDTVFLNFIGACTILIAGIRACAESDLKKVVALRTLSQLGVIMVSLGALEKSFCFFHLISHACFKALLFMCIGSFIHLIYGSQDYRRFNNLSSSLYLSIFSTVANLSLIGFLFTSGFFSKDMISELLYKTESEAVSLIIFLLGIGVTSCYSIKMLTSTMLVGSFNETCTSSHGGYS